MAYGNEIMKWRPRIYIRTVNIIQSFYEMSLPSSPRSECSTLSEYEFVADPEVVKMLASIITCRHGILHYHSQTRELTTFQW